MRKLIASVIKEVNTLSKEIYEDYLEEYLETHKIDTLRTIIHQNHQNQTDAAMITALNGYYRQKSQTDINRFKTGLMLVLYELKRDNSDKFTEFVQKYT